MSESRAMKSISAVTVFLAALGLWQTGAMAAGGCLGQANLPATDLIAFSGKPAILLDLTDSLALSTRVRSLVGSSDAALPLVIEQAKQATSAQMAAVGAGLARAANSCETPDPAYKLTIEKTVAEAVVADARLQPLVDAFAKALGETATAALGPGGAGAGAGAGASAIGNGGQIGTTGPGSDGGSPFEGSETSPGKLAASNTGFSGSFDESRTIFLSGNGGGQSSTDPGQSTSQSIPAIQ